MRSLTFGKYRLVAELGQGGMADVILALAQGPVGFNKLVVIKRLREHLAEDPEFISMLIDEARLAARLNHPHIVHTNEVGEIGGYFFMAMEYLQGQPLSRILRRATKQQKELSLDMQVRIVADCLAGLHYAHELADYDGTPLNVVHRDVTPSNIFVTYDGVVKVVDFGIAKASGRSTETKTGVVKGKMTYMAPEQALGMAIDRRADIFSVGVMLWEAATGVRMWKGIDEVVILTKLINHEVPRSPKEANPDVPEELDLICQKALASDPDERYASALEFQTALEDWLETRDKQVSTRLIGKAVSALFDKDREEIRDIIEKQLAKLKEEGAASLEPVEISDVIHSSRTPSSFSSTEISPGRERNSITVTTAAEPDTRSRSVLGLSIGLLAAVGAIVWMLVTSNEEGGTTSAEASQPTADATAAPAPPGNETAPSAAAEEMLVTLRAAPADARFKIDDGPWLENPFNSKRARDGKLHEVSVSADGYKTKVMEVRFDKDVILDVSLEKNAKKTRTRVVHVPTPVPAAPEPPAPRDTLIPPEARPKTSVEIDRSDPWKN